MAAFITFEGPEGSGKTTVICAVKTYLAERYQIRVLTTREPGGNPIAEQIRNILQADSAVNMDARTEALLFAAARRQHLIETVQPALAAGEMVISDRYIDSSLAYQGGGRRLGVDAVLAVNQFATDNLMPELTIYLDLPVEVGLARIEAHRSYKVDRLDRETLDFHQRVRETYLNLLKRFPERIKKIDASQDLEDVIEDTKQLLDTVLEGKS